MQPERAPDDPIAFLSELIRELDEQLSTFRDLRNDASRLLRETQAVRPDGTPEDANGA